MYRIGLTGGVGCGKSTVSAYMHQVGLPVIDADALAQEAVCPGSFAIKEIQRKFGNDVICQDGSLYREKMAQIVFHDEEKRELLNSIIHPYIWQRTSDILYHYQQEGKTIVVLDSPLLLENGGQLRVESVWVVVLPKEEQIRRVMERNHWSRDEVLARMERQMSTEDKIRYADVIIDNSGTLEETYHQIDQALQNIPGFITH